jgi:hypothetical protein
MRENKTLLVAFAADGQSLAIARAPNILAGASKDQVTLWSVATGQKLAQFELTSIMPATLTYSRSGRILALSGTTITQPPGKTDPFVIPIRLWETYVSQANKDAPNEKALNVMWADLAGDAAKADQALSAIVRAGNQGLTFLQARLRLVKAADAKQVAALIEGLDSKVAAQREEAARPGGTGRIRGESASRCARGQATSGSPPSNSPSVGETRRSYLAQSASH